MKKLVILLSLFASQTILAQNPKVEFKIHDIYTKFGVSYSYAASMSLYQFDPLGFKEFNALSYANPKIGIGFAASGGIGFMFHKNIGIENNFSFSYVSHSDLYKYKSSDKSIHSSLDNKYLLWQPAILFTTSLGKLSPYVKVGMVLPLMNQTIFQTEVSDASGNYNKYSYNISNKLNPGLNGALGATYKINDKWSIFGEVEECNIRTFYTQANLSESEIKGSVLTDKPVADMIKFGTPTQPQFPLSLGREMITLGMKYLIR